MLGLFAISFASAGIEQERGRENIWSPVEEGSEVLENRGFPKGEIARRPNGGITLQKPLVNGFC